MKETILSLLFALILQTAAHTTIEGVVLESDTDRPVAGVQVSAGAGLQTTSGDDGHFSINNVASGNYSLSTTKDGFAPARVDGRTLPGYSGIPLTVQAGESVRGLQIHIAKSAVITGRVLDSSGQPVFRARVGAMRKFYDENGQPGLALARSAEPTIAVNIAHSVWNLANTTSLSIPFPWAKCPLFRLTFRGQAKPLKLCPSK